MTTTSFHLSLQEILGRIRPKDALHLQRYDALRKFRELGLPEIGDEAFQYFPFHSFYETSLKVTDSLPNVDRGFIEKYLVPECQNACLVFVDGYFLKELSITEGIDPRVVVLPFEEASKPFGNFLLPRLSNQIKEEKDPFVLLNLAIHPQGCFLYIPPKLMLQQPIQVMHVITQEGSLAAPLLQVFVGLHAEVKLHITSTCQKKEALSIAVTDIVVEQGSHLEMTESSSNPCQKGWHMNYVRTRIKRDGFYSHTQVVQNSGGFRGDIRVDLDGENSAAELSGLAILQHQETSHLRAIVNHESPNTRSSQHFKGVLSGHSHSSVEGKIVVQKLAQKTQAYQLCNHLILDELARANTKPNLEIFADDVKASHGATVSRLAADELFYLLSRGIDSKEAKFLLIEGFCKEVFSKLFLDSQRQEIAQCLMSMK